MDSSQSYSLSGDLSAGAARETPETALVLQTRPGVSLDQELQTHVAAEGTD